MACTPCYTADLPTFRILFPELDGVDDATVQFYLDKSGCELSDTNWGCTLPEAQLYYSAHFIALSQERQSNASTDDDGNTVISGAAGVLTSASAGAISVGITPTITATQGNDANSFFTTTPYGRTYLYLKQTRMPIAEIAC